MKKIYYIKGNFDDADNIEQALRNKGGILDTVNFFGYKDILYYIDTNNIIQQVKYDSPEGKIIREFGTKLKPVKPKKPSKTSGKVIGKIKSNSTWTLVDMFKYTIDDDTFIFIGSEYAECHKYEPWMKKYLGTNTPYEEFKEE